VPAWKNLSIYLMPKALVFHSQSSKEAEQSLKLFKYFPVRLNKTKNISLERHAFV
jgi:hypothetical protein